MIVAQLLIIACPACFLVLLFTPYSLLLTSPRQAQGQPLRPSQGGSRTRPYSLLTPNSSLIPNRTSRHAGGLDQNQAGRGPEDAEKGDEQQAGEQGAAGRADEIGGKGPGHGRVVAAA